MNKGKQLIVFVIVVMLLTSSKAIGLDVNNPVNALIGEKKGYIAEKLHEIVIHERDGSVNSTTENVKEWGEGWDNDFIASFRGAQIMQWRDRKRSDGAELSDLTYLTEYFDIYFRRTGTNQFIYNKTAANIFWIQGDFAFIDKYPMYSNVIIMPKEWLSFEIISLMMWPSIRQTIQEMGKNLEDMEGQKVILWNESLATYIIGQGRWRPSEEIIKQVNDVFGEETFVEYGMFSTIREKNQVVGIKVTIQDELSMSPNDILKKARDNGIELPTFPGFYEDTHGYIFDSKTGWLKEYYEYYYHGVIRNEEWSEETWTTRMYQAGISPSLEKEVTKEKGLFLNVSFNEELGLLVLFIIPILRKKKFKTKKRKA